MGEAEDRGLEVWDEGDGLSLECPVAPGVTLKYYMSDAQVEDLIRIMQNKLNERWGR